MQCCVCCREEALLLLWVGGKMKCVLRQCYVKILALKQWYLLGLPRRSRCMALNTHWYGQPNGLVAMGPKALALKSFYWAALISSPHAPLPLYWLYWGRSYHPHTTPHSCLLLALLPPPWGASSRHHHPSPTSSCSTQALWGWEIHSLAIDRTGKLGIKVTVIMNNQKTHPAVTSHHSQLT